MASLYIHIPFCRIKCLYCSFVVNVAHEHYVDRYLRCLRQESHKRVAEELLSIYVGGGTPSVLSNNQIRVFFENVLNGFNFPNDMEITFETFSCKL